MTMLLHFSLLLAVVGCVRTRNDFSRSGLQIRDSEFNRFAFWPSVHNGAVLLRIRRENTGVDVQGPSEGISGAKLEAPTEHAPSIPSLPPKSNNATTVQPSEASPVPTTAKNETSKEKNAEAPPQVGVQTVQIKDNGTTSNRATAQWDIGKPDVLTRGMIVFGGFAVLALGYFMFYRTKKNYKDTNNSNTNDTNQFRYGVLQSEDRTDRENLELSRVPLTMESDDEEDEDLEIFDLEQKKKSMSYVNLQTNDEDIVLSPRDRNDDGILLDIEDGNSDTLINWSNNGSRSIL